MSSSRIASFYRLSVEERRRKIAEAVNLPGAEVDGAGADGSGAGGFAASGAGVVCAGGC